jgi:hypothetical protein
MKCPDFANALSILDQRTQAKPGADCTRSLVCSKKAHELVTTGSAGNTGFPRAMVLARYFVLCRPAEIPDSDFTYCDPASLGSGVALIQDRRKLAT